MEGNSCGLIWGTLLTPGGMENLEALQDIQFQFNN
jgi:hypothetical protein